MIRYEAPLALQERVTLVPAETDDALAVKLEMVGAAPCGTLDCV
jgi:hypothetical protein